MLKKSFSVFLCLLTMLSYLFVVGEPINAKAENYYSDIELANLQYEYKNKTEEVTYKGISRNVQFWEQGFYKYIYTTYEEGQEKGKKDIVYNKGSEEYITFTHNCIKRINKNTGTESIIINDADGDLVVTDSYIYYHSSVYNNGEGYNNCWGGVDYVRCDLNGNNREVLYHDNYKPFGSGIGGPPSIFVTNDYLYVSKYSIEQIDLDTKEVETVFDDEDDYFLGQLWIDILYAEGSDCYFTVIDNQSATLLGSFYKYSYENNVEEIFTVSREYDYGKWVTGSNGITNMEMHYYYYTTINGYGFRVSKGKEYEGIMLEPKSTCPIDSEGIAFVNTNSTDKTEKWYYNFSTNELNVIEINRSFKTDGKSYSKGNGFFYKDSYFDKDSTEFNQSLATMSLCLAFSTYAYGETDNYDKNVYDIMEKCGFNGETMYSEPRYISYNYNVKPTKNSIGCAIGSKKLKDGTFLIAVAVRSGGYGAEWSSNLDIGHTGDHYGFDSSANKVCDYIFNYLKELSYEEDLPSDIKIWITGFSRGAAVATQAAAKLNKKGESNGFNFSKKRIYCYGFATPAGAIESSNPDSADYNNIFNILHHDDIVPLLAPENWNFTRYGVTKIFPFKENAKSCSSYDKNMRIQFGKIDKAENYKLDEYRNYLPYTNASLGMFNKKLINSIAANIGVGGLGGGRQIYRLNYQSGFMKQLEDNEGIERLKVGEGTAKILFNNSTYRLIGKQLHYYPILTANAFANGKYLAEAHKNQSYYLAWMQSMDKNYFPTVDKPHYNKGEYRSVLFNCPIDVYVYDKNSNELVASIINEQPKEVKDSGVVATIDETDQKVVYLPIDGDYRIETVARENCESTISVKEYEGAGGNNSRYIAYSGINLEKDEKTSALATAYSDYEIENGTEQGSDAEYSLSKDDNSISPDIDVKGTDEIEKLSHKVTVNYNASQGTVYGEGIYIESEFAKLKAENKPGYDFDGFYIDQKKITDDDLDKNQYTVRFEVKDDMVVEARYKVCKHPKFKNTVTKPTCKGKGYTTHICTVCSYTYKDNYKNMLPHTYDSGKVTKYPNFTSAGVKTYTCKKCKAKKNVTIAKLISPSVKKLSKKKAAFVVKWAQNTTVDGYEIQYSLKKNMKGAKYIKADKNKTSAKAKKLKPKKKYYVRIRAYKYINGKKIYSKWSAVKKVKTK